MGGHMTLRQHAEGQRNGPRGCLAFEVRVWQYWAGDSPDYLQ